MDVDWWKDGDGRDLDYPDSVTPQTRQPEEDQEDEK